MVFPPFPRDRQMAWIQRHLWFAVISKHWTLDGSGEIRGKRHPPPPMAPAITFAALGLELSQVVCAWRSLMLRLGQGGRPLCDFSPSTPFPPLWPLSALSPSHLLLFLEFLSVCVRASGRASKRKGPAGGGGVWGLVSAHIFFSCSSRRLARDVECWGGGQWEGRVQPKCRECGEGPGIGKKVSTVGGESWKAQALGIPTRKGPRQPPPT